MANGLDSNSLLCAAETSGTRQIMHKAARYFTIPSGIFTIYQLPWMHAPGREITWRFPRAWMDLRFGMGKALDRRKVSRGTMRSSFEHENQLVQVVTFVIYVARNT
jgi:hypothetical protein